MSNENESVITEIIEGTSIIPETPVIVEVPEQIYEWQPKDDHDRPMGGKQVIKYRTNEELLSGFEKQNTELQKALRKERKNNRLGINDQAPIPESAVRFDDIAEFKPRDLTPDDRVRLARDLTDPERSGEAVDTIFESSVGVKPQVLRNTLSRLQENNLMLMAKLEADAFIGDNPGYHKCRENFETITDWLVKENLAPVRDNFQLAYDTLSASGLMLEAPIVREEVRPPAPVIPVVDEPIPVNSQPVQAEPSRITVEEPTQAKRPVPGLPTGLTRTDAADSGPMRPTSDEIVFDKLVTDAQGKRTGEKITYRGLEALEIMPSDEYKRRFLSDKTFGPRAEQLYKEQESRRVRGRR